MGSGSVQKRQGTPEQAGSHVGELEEADQTHRSARLSLDGQVDFACCCACASGGFACVE